MPKYNCRGNCGKNTTTEENHYIPGGWFCPDCWTKECNAPSGHNCSKCNKSLNKMEFKSAVGRDTSVMDDPSKAVCDSCCQGSENPDHRCTKCNKPFKYGENYTQVEDSSKAGNYHKSCWAKVEQERNNSNLACSKCHKKRDGLGNCECSIPVHNDAPTCRYYMDKDKRCGKCSMCQSILNIPTPVRYSNDDSRERERERESKIGTIHLINVPNAVNELTL